MMAMIGLPIQRIVARAAGHAGCAAAMMFLCAPAAQAGLGQSAASVEQDRAALHGTATTVTPMQAYDLHEITTADGRVREYVAHAGNVFAVTWSGRTRPDLAVVLGTRYDEYAKSAAVHRTGHKVFNQTTADLVIHVNKLPRGFVGEAHVPSLLPPGITAADLR